MNINILHFYRHVPDEALSYAEKALDAGAVPNRVRKQLEDDFGVNVNPKFLQNTKQKIRGEIWIYTLYVLVYNANVSALYFFLGLPKDEWVRSAKLLKEYHQKIGHTVKVLHDDDGVINFIYIQTAGQWEMFKRFSEIVQLDGTYSKSWWSRRTAAATC